MSKFYYVNVPTAAMWQHPTPTSEVVSEALFSEQVHILEELSEWVQIQTIVDNYTGWVKKEAIFASPEKFLCGSTDIVVQVNRCSAHLYHTQDTIFGPAMTLPFESKLKLVDPQDRDSTGRWIRVLLHNGNEGYIQRGDVAIAPRKLGSLSEMCDFSRRFLGLPYTWGGRSSFGYDCSGFVQMLYRHMGVFLPRDSKDQCVWEGFSDVTIERLEPGNLIFFGHSLEKIRHTGMYIGSGKFIHATVSENAPYIHISDIEGKEWKGDGTGTYPLRVGRSLSVVSSNTSTMT